MSKVWSVPLNVLPSKGEPKKKVIRINHWRHEGVLWGLQRAIKSVIGREGRKEMLTGEITVELCLKEEEEKKRVWGLEGIWGRIPWKFLRLVFSVFTYDFVGWPTPSSLPRTFRVIAMKSPDSHGTPQSQESQVIDHPTLWGEYWRHSRVTKHMEDSKQTWALLVWGLGCDQSMFVIA